MVSSKSPDPVATLYSCLHMPPAPILPLSHCRGGLKPPPYEAVEAPWPMSPICAQLSVTVLAVGRFAPDGYGTRALLYCPANVVPATGRAPGRASMLAAACPGSA